jgi:hypothetical protein
MGESLKSEKTVHEYLLGRVSDETTLEGIEELLFTDEEFCSQVALAEDVIINSYVFGQLDEADAASFEATLAGNPERRFKLELTQALRKGADQEPEGGGRHAFVLCFAQSVLPPAEVCRGVYHLADCRAGFGNLLQQPK